VMEAACRGAADEGGRSIGVIFDATRPNAWVSEAIFVRDLAERLGRLRDSADGWVFLPHGLGTMLELVWIGESVVKGDARARPLVMQGGSWRSIVETMLAEAAGPGRDLLAGSIRWASTPEEAAELALEESPESKV
jgi:predicted Rossmann-fold nucleotide-binding protein